MRAPVDVAVGVLIDNDGRFLLTSRPEGKVYAGHWEFPGGKVEAGESIEAALARELHEELGIEIAEARRWKIELVDYPHALVRLHFCQVRAWSGRFEMREGQQMAWQTLPTTVTPLLPGTRPVLRWFAEERASTLAAMNWLDAVKWDRDGLVPAIAQEQKSGDILMVAWMNRDALARTAALGEAVYWSRSRAALWHKGEQSGHFQRVHELRLDCDNDVVLLKVEQLGHEPSIACHTGRHSCFFQLLKDGAWQAVEPVLADPKDIYS